MLAYRPRGPESMAEGGASRRPPSQLHVLRRSLTHPDCMKKRTAAWETPSALPLTKLVNGDRPFVPFTPFARDSPRRLRSLRLAKESKMAKKGQEPLGPA
jgi:hypothetical protein